MGDGQLLGPDGKIDSITPAQQLALLSTVIQETGLYYYGARYYDPGTSIWQSVDPLAEKFNNTPGVSPPYSEITSILLDRNMEKLEKITHLRNITPGVTPYVSRSLDGKLLKSILTTSVLKSLEKMFTVIDIYSMAMMPVNGNNLMLEIPMIGGISQLIVGDAVASSDAIKLDIASKSGYVPLARVLNSSVGRRSGLVGVYVSEQTLQAILANGGINSSIKNIVDPGGYYPDNPKIQNGNLNYFVVYPKDSKGNITNFGVMPIH